AFRQQRHRGAARNDGEQVVPTAAYAAGMLLNQLTQRNTHLLFHVAGLVDMARDAEKFRARVIGTAKAREPARATAEDLRPDGNALDVVDCRGAAPDADVGREWRLQARLALVALKAFNERGFLTADIGARAAVHVDVEIIARAAGVFADQPGVIGLLNGIVEVTRFQHKLTADVDIGSTRAHRETGDKTPLQQAVRIEAHDLPVLAGAGLGFIRIDHQIARTAIGFFGHERPFEAGREARAAATAQAAVLDFLDDGVLPHIEQRF